MSDMRDKFSMNEKRDIFSIIVAINVYVGVVKAAADEMARNKSVIFVIAADLMLRLFSVVLEELHEVIINYDENNPRHVKFYELLKEIVDAKNKLEKSL